MIRFTRPSRAPIAVVSLFLVFAMAGCGTSPTAPVNSEGGVVTAPARGPQVLQVNPDGSAAWVALPSALQGPTPTGYDEAEFDPARYVTVAQRVDGAVGGRVVCGRFVATVPPGAFDGVGIVTMSLADSTLMLCDLEVSPAELNDFKVPIELSLHTTGTTAELDSLEIYWWDPAKSEWTAMGCSRTNALERVLADEWLTAEPAEGASLSLTHFSKYAGGKAGW